MNHTQGKNKRFSEIFLNNRFIIIFILFIIDWGISTWNWIAANQFLNLIDNIHYFLVLLYLTLVSYMYARIFSFVDSVKKTKLMTEKKVQSEMFNFSYTLFIWIVTHIIQFTEFTNQTFLVVFLTTIIFSGLINMIIIFTTDRMHKGITFTEMLIIFIVVTLLFYPFRFYNVELWRFILIIFFILGLTIWILTLFYFYLKGEPAPSKKI